MKEYVIRRILQMLLTIFVLITICFVLFRLIPGDPAALVVGPTLDPEAQAVLHKQFGLDQPIHVQYYFYMVNILKGNLGTSFVYRIPIMQIILERLMNTVVLMGTGMFFVFIIGVIIGTLLAWKRGSKIDTSGIVLSFAFRAAPIFWIGMILLSIFSYTLGWFPIGLMRTPGYDASNLFEKFFDLDFLHHMALPLICTILYYVGNPILVMRNSMLEVLGSEFIELAKAKGLKTGQIIFRHAARNAMLPVITLTSIELGYAIGGQVLLETVFSWPGMGRAIVEAVNSSDYPMAQGCFIFLGAIVITMNFITDLLYLYLDPRISYSVKGQTE